MSEKKKMSERMERLEKELNSMKGIERYRLTKEQIVNEQLYGSFNGKSK